jgi:hypothetical protein
VVPEFREHQLRARPKNWGEAHWRATYKFPDSPLRYDKTREDTRWVKKRFSRPPSDKDGFRVDECKSHREKRLLRFLVPILNPDKPTTCTLKLMKTIHEAYSNERVCGWGLILDDVVFREVSKIGGRKGCPLAPFIYHLYARYGILTTRKKEE